MGDPTFYVESQLKFLDFEYLKQSWKDLVYFGKSTNCMINKIIKSDLNIEVNGAFAIYT